MSDFGTVVEISAPAERVWLVMSDIERWPEWTASVSRVERIDPGPLAVGSRARIRQPRLLPAVWRVTELDPGRSFTWVTRSPGVRVTGQQRVEPWGPGSRAHLGLRFEGILGPLVARLAAALSNRYLALEAQGLKRRSEASGTGR
jgi:uncharacterized membrane protein